MMNVTIKIKLGDRDIELTSEEARELFAKLQEVFRDNPDPALPGTPYIPWRYDPGPSAYEPPWGTTRISGNIR